MHLQLVDRLGPWSYARVALSGPSRSAYGPWSCARGRILEVLSHRKGTVKRSRSSVHVEAVTAVRDGRDGHC